MNVAMKDETKTSDERMNAVRNIVSDLESKAVDIFESPKTMEWWKEYEINAKGLCDVLGLPGEGGSIDKLFEKLEFFMLEILVRAKTYNRLHMLFSYGSIELATWMNIYDALRVRIGELDLARLIQKESEKGNPSEVVQQLQIEESRHWLGLVLRGHTLFSHLAPHPASAMDKDLTHDIHKIVAMHEHLITTGQVE
ncbi:unnamed protein product [Peronospora belbahrii]|nr:unnamed protein product [Peronospora belbahrii]